MNKMTRTSAAILGSAMLLGGLAACSNDDAKNAANKATDAAGSVAAQASDAAGSAANKSSENGSASESSATNSEQASGANSSDQMSSESAQANMGEDIAETDLPKSIMDAASSFTGANGEQAGKFVAAKKLGDAVSAEYENVTLVDGPDTNGTQPLIGKIRETWMNKGGLSNEIGLPTEPEKQIDGGWQQTFTKKVMKWTSAEGQDYSDSYEAK